MTDPTRQGRERAGRRAEFLARVYLGLKGFRLLGRNVRTPYGEIDIVAKQGRMLVIVEVKLRREGVDIDRVVSLKQRQRLNRAATYLFEKGRYGDGLQGVRFDLILMRKGKWPQHWRDAWRP